MPDMRHTQLLQCTEVQWRNGCPGCFGCLSTNGTVLSWLALCTDVARAAGHVAAGAEDHVAAPVAAAGGVAGSQPEGVLREGRQPCRDAHNLGIRAGCDVISHVGINPEGSSSQGFWSPQALLV